MGGVAASAAGPQQRGSSIGEAGGLGNRWAYRPMVAPVEHAPFQREDRHGLGAPQAGPRLQEEQPASQLRQQRIACCLTLGLAVLLAIAIGIALVPFVSPLAEPRDLTRRSDSSDLSFAPPAPRLRAASLTQQSGHSSSHEEVATDSDGGRCCRRRAAECGACQANVSIRDFCLQRQHASWANCDGFCGLVDDGMLYVGGDVYSTRTDNALECCALCRGDVRCTSWTWSKRHHAEDFGVCYLKAQHELRRKADPGYISGLPGEDTAHYELRLMNQLQGELCLTHNHEGSVVISACGDSSKGKQRWFFDRTTSQVRSAEREGQQGGGTAASAPQKCLDTAHASRKGSSLLIRGCDLGSPSQRWVFDSDGGGRVENSWGFCWEPELGMPGAIVAAGSGLGAQVLISPCTVREANQRWTFRVWNYGAPVDGVALQPTSTTSTLTTTQTETSTTVTTTKPPYPTLFCWALMLPWNYEPSLMRAIFQARQSIFACEDWVVYSSEAIDLGSGYVTSKVDRDLHCPLGGVYHTALNTPIFKDVWSYVFRDGRYKFHDWTVKADPDAVFLPNRLKDLVRMRTIVLASESANGVLLNNCKFGLHGPLEVASRRALQAFADRRHTCEEPPQEDVYLQHCMQAIGVRLVNQWNLLAEAACSSPGWQSCATPSTTFHPFKGIDEWRTCQAAAESASGVWNPAELEIAPMSDLVKTAT
mmetsp:Transcript_37657/g.107001  ORF Transcript_37657/g.107001 Transcript_37657/m.107001 type:complete len:705 (+) Transcript_37657:69-2183(+)